MKKHCWIFYGCGHNELNIRPEFTTWFIKIVVYLVVRITPLKLNFLGLSVGYIESIVF